MQTRTKKGPFEQLKWLASTAGAMGVLLPGWGFFNAYAPPLFEAVSLVTGGLALAIVIYGLKNPLVHPARLKISITYIFAAMVLIACYGVLREYTTAGPPPEYVDTVGAGKLQPRRLQIGFHLARWSLTDRAAQYVAENNVYSVDELLKYTTYNQDKVYIAWKEWCVIAANLILIAVFVSGFVLWAYGFALLARTLAEPK